MEYVSICVHERLVLSSVKLPVVVWKRKMALWRSARKKPAKFDCSFSI